MTWRAGREVAFWLGILAVLCVAWAARGMEGPDKMVRRGAYLFNTSKPACSSCHTPKQNSLADYGSRGSEREARDWIQRPSRQFEKTGKRGMMPAYKLPDEDVEALVRYLLTLEE